MKSSFLSIKSHWITIKSPVFMVKPIKMVPFYFYESITIVSPWPRPVTSSKTTVSPATPGIAGIRPVARLYIKKNIHIIWIIIYIYIIYDTYIYNLKNIM
jgi:hypothetical protein